MNTISSLIEFLLNKVALDYAHPVGSFFETSNASFDPNVTWGGTWVLLGEGQVLLSAGSTYSIGTEYGANTHTLTDAQVAHGHGFTQPKIPNHTHSFTQPKLPNHTHSFTQPKIPNHTHFGYYRRDGSSSSGSRDRIGHRDSYTNSDIITTTSSGGGGACTGGAVGNPSSLPSCTGGAVGNPSSLPATTGGAVSNLYGASSARTAVSMMQKSTAVNIWHRTA